MSTAPDAIPDAEQQRRASIIERIRKLQRMTTDRGATEGEALQAAGLVQRLIAENNVLDSELSLRADAKHCVKDCFTAMRSAKPAWSNLGIAIEKLYGTIAWIERSSEDLLGLGFEVDCVSIYYYGFPLDVTGSICTLAICATALDSEIANLPKRTRKIERESFELGMTDRLRERIREMRSRAVEEAKGKGALVVLKSQLVNDEFTKLGIKLHRSAVKNRKIDMGSYHAGKAAGSAVPLDRPLSPTQRTARLT